MNSSIIRFSEKHIGYSRDDSFLSIVKMHAPNKGCDIVINCASGSIREVSTYFLTLINKLHKRFKRALLHQSRPIV